ncbi:MAG: PAS domain-containing protein [Thermodesulfobacteriota bacterium]|nr:PAS domain-containing protein [Thermodesulfobacteriota bacterium]
MTEFLDLKIFQYCATAVFVIDTDHNVLFWNKACEKLTGFKADYMMSTAMQWKGFYDHARPCLSDLILDRKFDLIPDYYDVYGKSTLLKDGWHAEGWYYNLGGLNRYIIFDAAPVYNSKGNLVGAVETLQDISERKRIEEKNEKLAKELQETLDKVKLLSGLIPICASCKKIRDDRGYWNQIELYIRDHSEAIFSHGICPDCSKKLYPEINVNREKSNPE